MSLSKTPKQTAHAAKDLSLVRGMTNKLLNGNAIVVEQEQQSQPPSKDDHNDIVVVDGDVDRSEYTREEIEAAIEKMSDPGAFSDENVDDSADDDDEVVDDDDNDEGDTFMMKIIGHDGCLAMAAQALVGKRFALDTDSSAVKPKEMWNVAKMYLFGSNNLSEEEATLVDDCLDKMKKELKEKKLKRFSPFSKEKKELLKKLHIDETTDWQDVVSDFNDLLDKCEELEEKEDVDQEIYSRLFLAAFRSVKIWSEKLAEEKAKSKKLMKSYMHEARSANAVQERKLDNLMHEHVKTYHIKSETYDVVTDEKNGVDGSTLFASVLYNASTLNDEEVEMKIPTKLLYDHALRSAAGKTALRAHVAMAHIESKYGSIMELVRGSRNHGGILRAATHFLRESPKKKAKLITRLSMSTQLKEDQYYANHKSYGDGGKQHLCYTGQLLEVKQNGELGIYIPNVKGKHAPTLVVGTDYPLTEEVEKKLKELHYYKQFASSAKQAKYVNASLKLAKAINLSGVCLTDSRETQCVTSLKYWARQLNECAKEGKGVKAKRGDGKSKKRTRDDVERDSDGATSVISNATTTTNVSSGTPQRKKKKKKINPVSDQNSDSDNSSDSDDDSSDNSDSGSD